MLAFEALQVPPFEGILIFRNDVGLVLGGTVIGRLTDFAGFLFLEGD